MLEEQTRRPRGGRDRLEARVKKLEVLSGQLYHDLQLRTRYLEVIHRSRMWRLWMAYLGLRGAVLGWPLRMARGVRASAAGLLRRLAHLCGWAFLFFLTPVVFLRARLRSRGQTKEVVSQSGPGLAPEAAGRRPRVLIVMPYAIHPPDHGGGVRLFNLIRYLSGPCDISVLIFSQTGEDRGQREALEPWCRSVDFHHWTPRLGPDPFGLEPPNAQIFASDAAHRTIRDLIDKYEIDILQLEYTELGQYHAAAPEHVKVILTEHDIAFRSLDRRRRQGFNKRFPEGNLFGNTRTDWRRLIRYELSVCRRSDQIHVMSEDDGSFLAGFLPDGRRRLRVMPNGVDVTHYRPPASPAERSGVLLVGNFQNLPNVDSLEYLIADIWPLLRRRHPGETLTVVGAKPSRHVLRFDGRDGISVVGAVPDVKPYYLSHRVLAAPIRAGSGTRLKLLEAFAAGLPVVSTTLGAEGIAHEEGRHLLIADTAESFAAALGRLLTEDDLHERIAGEARRLASSKYDWRHVAKAMLASYVDLAGPRLAKGASPKKEEAPEKAPELVPAAEELRPRVTEPVTAGREAGVPRPEVLVTGIYLANRPNFVEDIVAILSKTEHFRISQNWVALMGEPPTDAIARVTVKSFRERRPKCSILNEVLAEHDLARYEYVVICDDDVALPERFLDQFLTLQARLDFAIAQPARTVNSFIDLPIVEQHPGVLARETLFVEQGPVISFHRSTFEFVLPFDMRSPMGWGLENVWSLEASKRGLRMGILDNIPVDHSMRRPVANYGWKEAARGRAELFLSVDHRPNEECFKVLRLVPLTGSSR